MCLSALSVLFTFVTVVLGQANKEQAFLGIKGKGYDINGMLISGVVPDKKAATPLLNVYPSNDNGQDDEEDYVEDEDEDDDEEEAPTATFTVDVLPSASSVCPISFYFDPNQLRCRSCQTFTIAGPTFCDDVENCDCTLQNGICSFFNTTTCSQCMTGFYTNSLSRCQPCNTNAIARAGNCFDQLSVNTCSGPNGLTDVTCFQCAIGYFSNSQGVCETCQTPLTQAVGNCATPQDVTFCSPITYCNNCAAGYFKSPNTGRCETCNGLQFTQATGCVNGTVTSCSGFGITNVQCSSCAAGYYATAGGCNTCQTAVFRAIATTNGCPTSQPISACDPLAGTATCGTCSSNQYHDVNNACQNCRTSAILSVGNCASQADIIGCIGNTGTDAVLCSACAPGYFLDSSGHCLDCNHEPAIVQSGNCLAVLTCNSTSALTCSSCQSGYYLTNASTCMQCVVPVGCAGNVTCTSTGTVCDRCATGYVFGSQSGGTCVTSASTCGFLNSCNWTGAYESSTLPGQPGAVVIQKLSYYSGGQAQYHLSTLYFQSTSAYALIETTTPGVFKLRREAGAPLPLPATNPGLYRLESDCKTITGLDPSKPDVLSRPTARYDSACGGSSIIG